jgi:hypothetical protein
MMARRHPGFLARIKFPPRCATMPWLRSSHGNYKARSRAPGVCGVPGALDELLGAARPLMAEHAQQKPESWRRFALALAGVSSWRLPRRPARPCGLPFFARRASEPACNSVVGISNMLGLRSLRKASPIIMPAARFETAIQSKLIVVEIDLPFMLETLSDSTRITHDLFLPDPKGSATFGIML